MPISSPSKNLRHLWRSSSNFHPVSKPFLSLPFRASIAWYYHSFFLFKPRLPLCHLLISPPRGGILSLYAFFRIREGGFLGKRPSMRDGRGAWKSRWQERLSGRGYLLLLSKMQRAF